MNAVKTFWKPEINDEIRGEYVEVLDKVGKYASKVYKIRTGNEIIGIWGKRQLDSIMQSAKIGDIISLNYVVTEKVNDHDMKRFELEILNDRKD